VHGGGRGRVPVALVDGQGRLVDAVQAPRRADLGVVGADHDVLLDVGHARVGGQLAGLAVGHPRGEAVHGVAPRGAHGAAVLAGELAGRGRDRGLGRRAVLEHHEEAALDRGRVVGAEHLPLGWAGHGHQETRGGGQHGPARGDPPE
jgi:hypothetical protein